MARLPRSSQHLLSPNSLTLMPLFAGIVCVLALAFAPSGFAASEPVCSPAIKGFATCHAKVVAHKGAPTVNAAPTGYGPADLQAAYGLNSAVGGVGQTIATVIAYDAPTAEADVATYRSYYGLPACRASTGCFRKVNQTGGTKYPRTNAGWAQEALLDLDMASAVCPNCKLLLVEANSASVADLAIAVNTAVALGATVVSNSYGAQEFSGETAFAASYSHAGVPITVSSGDAGYRAEYPASLASVISVGGTSLYRDASARGFREAAWSGAGSACSPFIAKPAWQTDADCAMRAGSDVSAVADPATGVAVYASQAYQGRKGWLTFGGTSASAPLIAGVYALAGNGASVGPGASALWSAPAGSLNDVTTGSNGTCGGSYLCTAGVGYDGPTGWGTPSGTTAF